MTSKQLIICISVFISLSYSGYSKDSIPQRSKTGNSTTNFDISFGWKNTHFSSSKYPKMKNPLIINTQIQLRKYLSKYSELPPGGKNKSILTPAGNVYAIQPANRSKDIILDARKLNIHIPVKISEARHVWVIGGVWKTKRDPKGAEGLLANMSKKGSIIPGVNLYPRVVGGSMLQISNSGTLIIEGIDMDINGHNIDAIVTNKNQSQTPENALSQKCMYLINSRIRGFRGHSANFEDGGAVGKPLGDGFHADAFQYQSQTAHQELIFENLVIESGQEGLVSTSVDVQAHRSVYSKIKAIYDKRFIDQNKNHWSYIAPIGTNPKFLLFEDCYLYKSQVYSPAAKALGTNENHVLYWFKNKRMYFTDGNGSKWGNAGYGNKDTPVPSGLELNMSQWTPVPYDPKSYTSVVKHKGLHTISGTLSGESIIDPPNTDFAPAIHIGKYYKANQVLY